MPPPVAPEDEVEAAVRAFFDTAADPAVEPTVAFVASDFTGLGTGADDVYPDRASVVALFAREKADALDLPVSEIGWLEVRMLRDDLALAEGAVDSEVIVEGEAYRVDPRFSIVLERRGGRWLMVHFHFSMPDARQQAGDTLAQTLQRHNQELQALVEARTEALERSLAELRSAQARLVQSEKMASLGALTAGIAHEIKNPLNFVNNFAALSQELVAELDGEADPGERAAILDDLRANAAKIEQHGRRADAIVRQMMAHARGGSGERRAVGLNALVEEYAQHAVHAAEARHPGAAPALQFELASDAGEVDVVASEIGRVVVNLVDNALAAVRQRAADAPAGYRPGVTVATARRGDAAEVRVSDNGPGLGAESQARVFEPFYTTKPAGEGTGLGLSLSHDIVVQGHGGELDVESEPGAGATFVLRLPTPADGGARAAGSDEPR